ncbi:MAG: efflux RND transporter periplasmic adaptor subunit [Verrucomicrobia bacterium]|nr:MAG: efflux RND transporter periplasmic adaptor subunit [Verrucomicrobiota bacterium]
MKSITVRLFVLAVLFVSSACSKPSQSRKPPDVDYYTCTMHPSVHAEAPGKCPICGMELVPVMKKSTSPSAFESSSGGGMQGMAGMPGMQSGKQTSGVPSHEFVVPVERQQQIGVTYATVTRAPLHHTIRAVGTVEPDLQHHWAFVARVDGYVQELFVPSAGQIVEKDAPLLSIYSPDLLTTSRELVMLLGMRDEAKAREARVTPERLIASAESRLRQWNVTDEQIAELERTRQPTEASTLRSPFRGVVQEVAARQGVNVKVGDRLIDIADLSVVWIWAEFYESELSMLQTGQRVTVTSSAFPNDRFEGRVALINPFVDQAKRTAKVRIDIPNPDFKLRPGIYTDVELGMDMGEGLTVPASAVMPTGSREIAFVDKGGGKLEPRIIKLGEQIGDHYEVKSGLAEGERVVTSANFLIDAESKVQGALKDFTAASTEQRH